MKSSVFMKKLLEKITIIIIIVVKICYCLKVEHLNLRILILAFTNLMAKLKK